MSVLIVDDHAMFRAQARAILEADGFNVIGESADAASAVAQVGVLQPEIVLLDVHLPDRDGFAVAEELAAQENPPTVVLVSTRDALDLGSRLRTTRALGFIQKDDLSGAALRDLLTGGHEPDGHHG